MICQWHSSKNPTFTLTINPSWTNHIISSLIFGLFTPFPTKNINLTTPSRNPIMYNLFGDFDKNREFICCNVANCFGRNCRDSLPNIIKNIFCSIFFISQYTDGVRGVCYFYTSWPEVVRALNRIDGRTGPV